MATKLRVTIGTREFAASVEAGVVTIDGVEGTFEVAAGADGRWTVRQGDARSVGAALKAQDGTWVTLAGITARADVEGAGARPRSRTSDADALRPPMSATVVRIHVTAGAVVNEGDPLLVLEAMKMELPIRAPRDGVVKAVHCREGELVQPATILVDFE
ncbi:MAG: biotin/lipoyl-binding protein [Acidimicrobiia bacterium]|nr:biotin/lipoyl-binding protein [Acidimicrobiia bacterium]